MQDLRQDKYIAYDLARGSGRCSFYVNEVRMRRESYLVATVAFICRGTVRYTGSSDASGQMHLRIAKVICTCHIFSFLYVTHKTYARYTLLTNVYLYSNN